MGLFKKVLIFGVSIVAVAGIATGVGIAVNNSRHAEIMSDKDEENPDSTTTPEMVNLQELINSIQPSNIVFKSTIQPVAVNTKALTPSINNNKDGRETVYAFNVTSKQLDLDEVTKAKLAEKKVKVEIEIINTANNGALLNDGKLNINLKGSFIENTEPNEVKNKGLEIGGFKGIDQALKTFFVKTTQENKAAVINLTKAKNEDTPIALTSIEKLNTKTAVKAKSARSAAPTLTSNPGEAETQMQMISGISSLFQMVNTPTESEGTNSVMNVFVDGEVKLGDISKDSTGVTLFHLVSKQDNKPLKLIQKVNETNTNEALVNEIVVTNLLASKISLDIKDLEQDDKQIEFLKKYQDQGMTEGYMVNDGNITLKVPAQSSGTGNGVHLSVKPLLLKRTSQDQEIKANVTISYGSDETAKTYSTSKKEDIDKLKAAGVSLEIYSKKVGGNEEIVKAQTLNTSETNKLDTFFTTETLKTGIEKNKLVKGGRGDDKDNPIAEYSVVSSTTDSFGSDFVLGKVTSIKWTDVKEVKMVQARTMKLDVPQTDWVNENWISFVGYSFNDELKNKVLFDSSITLIHVSEPKATVSAGGEK